MKEEKRRKKNSFSQKTKEKGNENYDAVTVLEQTSIQTPVLCATNVVIEP